MTPNICVSISVLLTCLVMSSNAFACSTAAWLGGTSGAVSVNNPANGVPSVSGSCGLKVTGAGYVQDNNPETEAQFIGRFYFFPQFSGEGSADIFVAYSDEASTELFSVGYDGSNVTIDSAAPGGGSASVSVSGAGWHLIEFSWVSGDSGGLWVDADASQDPPSATFASGSGAVESVRLGAPNGFVGLSGMAFFDDYVSQRATPIGGILAGDANLNGIIDSSDIDAIKSEFLYGTYSVGSTDCNLDGGLNSGDINCVVEKL
ncbi:hypothetical protein ACFL33_02840 [Pseudomonadota bacterium]